MSFKSIEGQDRAVGLLQQSLKIGKVHHAYLFSGLDGIGKKKTALELAKALNCLQPGPEGGCDRCESCLKLDRAGHPDFIHLQPEGSQIRIEQIRRLEEQISFRPYLSRHRLCLLDKASEMNLFSASAFLKTLEEPPEGNVFVLLVNDPGELLPTLVSRCLLLQFRPLPEALITRKLREQGVAEEEARSLSRLSGGSLGRAVYWQEADFWKKPEAWIRQLELLSPLRISPLLENIKKWVGTREAMLEELEVGRICLRDILWIRLGLENRIVLSTGWKARLAALAGRHPEAVWLKQVALINQTAEDLIRQSNPQLTWEILWIKMARSAN